MSEVTGRSVTAELAERELDGRDRRFHQAQRAVRAGGVSPGAWIAAETQGLDHWRIRIKGGALRALSEHEFMAGATAVLERVLAAYRGRDRGLRDEFFDLKLPEEGRNGRQR